MDALTALFEKQDSAYADFLARLTPSVSRERIIGVRAPDIKKLAARMDSRDALSFFYALPHHYLEENLLHGALIARCCKTYGDALQRVNAFLPYIDNWAVCDTLSPPSFKKEPEKLYAEVKTWLASGRVYTVRFGLICLMRFFLGENYRPDALELAAGAKGDYYIDMAAAWFFCEALIKRWEDAIKWIEKGALSSSVHNKAIQKARESFRITPQQKEYLKSLKRPR